MRKSSGLNAYEIRDAGGAYLADVWGVDVPIPNGVKPGQAKANARMIAALPELLEAAKAIVERANEEGWRCYRGTDESRLDILEAAIAKAEGK